MTVTASLPDRTGENTSVTFEIQYPSEESSGSPSEGGTIDPGEVDSPSLDTRAISRSKTHPSFKLVVSSGDNGTTDPNPDQWIRCRNQKRPLWNYRKQKNRLVVGHITFMSMRQDSGTIRRHPSSWMALFIRSTQRGQPRNRVFSSNVSSHREGSDSMTLPIHMMKRILPIGSFSLTEQSDQSTSTLLRVDSRTYESMNYSALPLSAPK